MVARARTQSVYRDAPEKCYARVSQQKDASRARARYRKAIEDVAAATAHTL